MVIFDWYYASIFINISTKSTLLTRLKQLFGEHNVKRGLNQVETWLEIPHQLQ